MDKFIIFVFGAGIGGLGTWLLIKEYYHRLADQEIESVISRFEDRNSAKNEEPKKDKQEEQDKRIYMKLAQNYNKPNIIDYAAKYNDENVDYTATEHPEDDDEETPYVISPTEFGELDDYDKITLTYYADGYLVEGDDGIIDDVEAVVGPDALDSFGEYEEDAVYVRNDQHKADYEILQSEMNYREE